MRTGIPNHLQQLLVPAKLSIKPDPVGIPGDHLQFYAGDVLCVKPFQGERQEFPAYSRSPARVRHKNLTDGADGSGTEIGRKSSDSSRYETDDFAVLLRHYDAGKAAQKWSHRFEPGLIGALW